MGRLRGLLFASLLLPVACTGAAVEPASDGLYEDIPDDGKADGSSLPAVHRVVAYGAIQEGRIVVDQLQLTGFSASRSFSVGVDDRLLLIRELTLDGVPSYVAADVDRMRFGIASARAVEDATRPAEDDELADAPYMEALASSRDETFSSLREGLVSPGKTRFALTIDMCQSSHGWDRAFFDWLVAHGPFSVGLAMTGLWATHHPREFRQLVKWQNEGKLDITWVNHSYRHEVSLRSGKYWFLTLPSIDFDADVLDLEKLLLGQGILFSPLFRFPGQTHNEERRTQLNDLSLFALDADAWIAKQQPIHDDAVVLLHGNGNEKQGISMFLDQVAHRGVSTLQLVSPTEVLPVPAL